jgi:hypothetical protein
VFPHAARFCIVDKPEGVCFCRLLAVSSRVACCATILVHVYPWLMSLPLLLARSSIFFSILAIHSVWLGVFVRSLLHDACRMEEVVDFGRRPFVLDAANSLDICKSVGWLVA